MAVITLTTDWWKSDYYVGAVKGKIVSRDVASVIVDISHQIAAYNIMQAAFVLRNCYQEFPVGTIHIVGVNSILSAKRSLLIIEKDKQYFLCSDTGFPGLIFPNQETKVYRYKVDSGTGNTFASLDIFVDVAFKIIKGEKIADFASECTDYIMQVPIRPTIDNNLINGSVVYIDSFSNAITNISRETFNRVGEGSGFELFAQSNHYVIDNISTSYADVATGELLALFNSSDLLEIAISNGPAAELLNLSVNSTIRIKFTGVKIENDLLLSGE
jgi:S-adenosyl-L-methionine hydrolase (adenosine-forming)